MIQHLIDKIRRFSKLTILWTFEARDVDSLKEKTFWRKKNQVQESENRGDGGRSTSLLWVTQEVASEPASHPASTPTCCATSRKPFSCLLIWNRSLHWSSFLLRQMEVNPNSIRTRKGVGYPVTNVCLIKELFGWSSQVQATQVTLRAHGFP